MTAGNHVSGGLVFTGVFASFWDINIFSSVSFILFTGIMSMLPDIDHTKSPIGKAFFPLAKWLDRHYGHRTVTHSFIFLIVLWLLSLGIESVFRENHTYSIILFFAVLSHYILDMITMQGIPFFYPFFKNPCVLPANPRLRLRSGNKRAELAVFMISLLLMFSCLNLFKNGFWTSYNRAFGTIKHVHNENKISDRLLAVEYDFVKNDKRHKGLAYLVESQDNELVLFDSTVFRLSKHDEYLKINSVKPLETTHKKIVNEIGFFNVSYDSLHNLIRDKIISGQIQSSCAVEVIEKNITRKTNVLKLDCAYQLGINFSIDSASRDIKNKLEKLYIKLDEDKEAYERKRLKINDMVIELRADEELASNEEDIYKKNKLQQEIIKLRREIDQKEKGIGFYKPDPLILHEIKTLQEMLDKSLIMFSGVVTYPVIPSRLIDVSLKNSNCVLSSL